MQPIRIDPGLTMAMRAQQVVPPGSWDREEERGTVALDFDGRHRRRFVLPLSAADELLVDLPTTMRLRDGDGLLLDGGGVVRVVAAAEALLEITAPDAQALMRIAWHLGNRHLPVQIAGERLRIRHDHVIAAMVTGLGGRADPIDAAFDPEAGAYAGGDHGSHGHGHDDAVAE